MKNQSRSAREAVLQLLVTSNSIAKYSLIEAFSSSARRGELAILTYRGSLEEFRSTYLFRAANPHPSLDILGIVDVLQAISLITGEISVKSTSWTVMERTGLPFNLLILELFEEGRTVALANKGYSTRRVDSLEAWAIDRNSTHKALSIMAQRLLSDDIDSSVEALLLGLSDESFQWLSYILCNAHEHERAIHLQKKLFARLPQAVQDGILPSTEVALSRVEQRGLLASLPRHFRTPGAASAMETALRHSDYFASDKLSLEELRMKALLDQRTKIER